MRAIEDWADRKYLPGTNTAHVVGWGEVHAQCGVTGDWYGTGSFDEIEHAQRLDLCTSCIKPKRPDRPTFNEFNAPAPLYAHATPEDN